MLSLRSPSIDTRSLTLFPETMAMSPDIRFQTHHSVRSLIALLALVTTLLALPLAAQEPTAKEVIDVRVTNVEVIATDSKGNHVPGLTRDDFELYENGKLQPITNLFEASAGAGGAQDAAPKAAPRRLVLYLDDSTLLPNNRRLLIPSLKKFVAEAMTPDDQMMIVTFNQSSKVRLPWTSDVAAVQTMLDTIGREVGGGILRQAARGRMENEIREVVSRDQSIHLSEDQNTFGAQAPDGEFRVLLTKVRNYASSIKYDFGLSAGALEKLFGGLAGIDGRKIVFVASESFPIHPGSEMYAQLETVRNQILSGNGSEGLKRGAQTSSVGAAAAEFNMNESILMLARVANASGVTVYALDPDIGGRSDSGNVQQMGSEMMTNPTAAAVAAAIEIDGMQVLAAATGGQAWIGMKPAMAFDKLRADLDNYYSIGYQARTSGDAERAIEVKSKRPGVRVRTKQNIVFRTAESEMAERVTSNLQSAQLNDLGITLEVGGDITTEGDKRHVPLHVLIPARNITVAAEGDVLTGGFSVYICSAGGKSEPSDVTLRSHEIKWPPSAIEQLGDRNMTFALEVVLEKGRDLISIGVLDHRSQATGFSKLEM
jgi:VWFA-related protein